MEAPKIAQFARNFTVMVRVQGPVSTKTTLVPLLFLNLSSYHLGFLVPLCFARLGYFGFKDPKGMKMRRNAFHLHESGKTSISASGLLLLASSLSQIPRVVEEVCSIHKFSGAVVVTVASIVEPFLIAEHRNKLIQDMLQELSPRLILDACIDVLIEAVSSHQGTEATSKWLPAKLLALIDVPAASDALLSLIGAQSSWEASWSLVSLNAHQPLELVGFERKVDGVESRRDAALEESDSSILLARSITRIACLGISTPDIKLQENLHLNISQHQNRGDLIVVMGSPFGVLSPMHFFNSISVGNVGNCFPSGSGYSSLLLADMRCLPGMEGGPVFDRHSRLVGILTKPLRQKGTNAGIQFAVTWNAMASICIKSMQPEDQNTQVGLIDRTKHSSQVASSDGSRHFGPQTCLIGRPALSGTSLTFLEKAISSVVLVAVGEGSWASGVVLNNNGLILTNAHILEPLRFGRTSLMGLTAKGTSLTMIQTPLDQQENKFVEKEKGIHLGSSVSSHGEMFSAFGYQSSRRISVRLDFMQKQIWYSAQAVYVSQGPLDVALLQLESVQSQLSPITPQLSCPSEGSVVYVIGHGLLGPISNVLPSISSGILSNVVQMPGPILISGSCRTEPREISMPVMLQTTAAVHPGASGGAVINSTGHMIGLVTSNARHGGGTIIPHLNFSIPCAALDPIFKFSETQDASIFQVLDKPNEVLSSVWALAPSQSKKPQSELQNKNYREGKGSRFSQFLADKNVGLTLKEIDLKKVEIPSKI